MAFGLETGKTLHCSAPGEVAEEVLQTLGPVADDRAAQISLLSLGGPRDHADPALPWEKGRQWMSNFFP